MADIKSSAIDSLTPAGFTVIDETPPTQRELQQEREFNEWFRGEVEKDHSADVRVAEDAQRSRVLEFVQESIQKTVQTLYNATSPAADAPPPSPTNWP